jgi:hypothetical protein
VRATVNQRKARAINKELTQQLETITQKELTRLYRNLRRELVLTNRHKPELAKFATNDIFPSFISRLIKRYLGIFAIFGVSLSALTVATYLHQSGKKPEPSITQIPEEFLFDSDQLARQLEPYLAQRITKVTQNIKRTVARKVTAWYTRPGSTLQDIVDELAPMNEGSPFGKARAHLIATTEISHLNFMIQEQTAFRLGAKKWWWQTRLDSLVCVKPLIGPDGRTYKGCRELHGKVFRVGSDKMRPVHIGDRCDPVIMVVDKLQKWDEAEHPRAKDGEFTSGGGSSSNKSSKVDLWGGGSINASVIGNIKGTDVYRVDSFNDFHKTRGGILLVGIKGKEKGSVLFAQGGDANSHGEVASLVDTDVDDYVRFTWDRSGKQLWADKQYAASLDEDEGLKNIYTALDRLNAKGVPDNTGVLITSGRKYANGVNVINTTVKMVQSELKKSRS